MLNLEPNGRFENLRRHVLNIWVLDGDKCSITIITIANKRTNGRISQQRLQPIELRGQMS